MRWLCAALILLAGICTAAADIRIEVSRYAGGKLIVQGTTRANRAVTLDKKYKTKSDSEGDFSFAIENYKPNDCMSDIRSGADVYSAVIAGCFTTGIGVNPTVGKQP